MGEEIVTQGIYDFQAEKDPHKESLEITIVKHGETLRRFNASIDDNKLSLEIVMLQNKIRRLFFESNVRFTMTYVDEDGDVITLATNDDLHDIVK
ncbi:PB1 domain, Zinc finger, ZZ-type, UBA-like, Next to BRCA1, central domain protein [Artemisia annua]|uniref:PB1 domain, Zinc finger, ZZ-type, UBA-like, Next to BRCA1, central domain protein n=1 Tax=Artemisia annua TaxID=35608 RepID=A0A2U1P8I4_ARTAN|nr:PB1 domain, Zinc finger, ZZ-type, UBA-like, Next to BRCA1, central domain protein [Artemisia annua]